MLEIVVVVAAAVAAVEGTSYFAGMEIVVAVVETAVAAAAVGVAEVWRTTKTTL